MYDVVVIGAGPAGLSAAINVRQRGGQVLCAALSQENNPLMKAEKIDNYPGLPGYTGAQLLEAFHSHAASMGVEFLEARVLNAFSDGKKWMLSAGSDVLTAYAVVFAGGITRGKPFPGEEKFLGRGVSYCATCDGMLYRGKKVVVIGFGDADRKEAEFLESIGCEVTWLLKPAGVEIGGDKRVEYLLQGGRKLEAEGVFILRPSLAPTSVFPGLELDGSYIRVDREMQTNLPGLFAAGDCTGTPLQVANAVGDGLIAGQKAMAFAVGQKKAEAGRE